MLQFYHLHLFSKYIIETIFIVNMSPLPFFNLEILFNISSDNTKKQNINDY